MNLVYWISRLDYLREMFGLFTDIGIVMLAIVGIVWLISICSKKMFTPETKEALKIKMRKSIYIWSGVVILSVILQTLTPTVKEGCVIVGAGTVINYLRESPEATAFPDKCFSAVNRSIDKISDGKPDTAETVAAPPLKPVVSDTATAQTASVNAENKPSLISNAIAYTTNLTNSLVTRKDLIQAKDFLVQANKAFKNSVPLSVLDFLDYAVPTENNVKKQTKPIAKK